MAPLITQAASLLLRGDPSSRQRARTGAFRRLSVMDWHSNIRIDIVERDGTVVVVVEGEVDLDSAPEFEQSLTAAAATDPAAIIVDLDGVSFMDSAGVHVLLQFSVSRPEPNRLTVTPGSPQVRRLLEVTGVRRYLSSAAPAGL